MRKIFGCVLLLGILGGAFYSHAGGLERSPKTQLSAVHKELRPRRIALLIGVSRYKHSSWNDLRYPRQDVQKVHQFLQKDGQFDEIISLVQPEQTTKKGVMQGLEWLKQRNRSARDTVLIYISGHGTIAQRQAGLPPERYLVTTDSDRDVPRTGVSLATLRGHLQMLPSQRKVVILATCYVGSTRTKSKVKSIKGVHSGIKGVYQLGWISRSTLVLSAAGLMQPAYEMSSLRGDVYTHFLLRCARQLLGKQQYVTAAQAHHCATPLTYRFIRKQLGRHQTPLIESKITGRDTLYLAGRALQDAISTEPPLQMGWLKLKRSRYQQVSIHPVGQKGQGDTWDLRTQQAEGFLLLRLLPGRYRLQLDSPIRGRHIQEIVIQPGQTQLLTPDVQAPKADDIPSAVDYFEIHPMGLFFEFGPDLQMSERLQIAGRFGFFSPYVSTALVIALGPSVETPGQPGDILFRFGLNGQFGYPVQVSRVTFFFNLYTEIGFWNTYESWTTADVAFLFVYGPHIRMRWWVTETVAIRLSVALLFSVSPDQRVSPGSNEFQWSHRPHLSFGLGFDFGIPNWR